MFPPGDTNWRLLRNASGWREFAFMLHQVQKAIDPVTNLRSVIQGWNEIAQNLAEPSRDRKTQTRAMHTLLS